MTARSIALFIVAALAEIGGAYLNVALGALTLAGAAICLAGVAVIMYAR